MKEKKHVFPSHGLACEGSLFLPAEDKPPLVLMGHGFAAERTFGTASAINAFVDAGYAVFAFDYRNFGASQGEPRQLVDPQRHCQDWYSAIQYVRSLQEIDANRIVLWGSSLGGGHVLATAARYHRLAGVIALVPFCNSRSLPGTIPLTRTLSGIGHALLDLTLSIVGREHRVAVVGEAGDGFACLDWPGWKADYLRLAAGSSTWVNSLPARSLLRLNKYNPADQARDIDCPVLIVNGKRDQAVPREDILTLVEQLKDCTHREYNFDHFDLYDGWELNQQAIEVQLSFLDQAFTA
jgi:fermentation-respiration switch protein FrsA (DUF1100 family)